MSLTTPVIFIIFNRPDVTQRVFEQIRLAQPSQLLVIADGPRPDRQGEAEKCEKARAIVMDHIDWPCEVMTNFSEINLGCGKRVSSGISWAFEQVEEAIILEDDCLPDPSFFGYCQDLLEYYRDNHRIMHISGADMLGTGSHLNASYYFSNNAHVWGWATWRRAWSHYDFRMSSWPEFRDRKLLQAVVKSKAEMYSRTTLLDKTMAGEIDTWDYQWNYAVWANGGISISPTRNLISNIGFGPDATHTFGSSELAGNPTVPLGSLIHPPAIFQPEMDIDHRQYILRRPSLRFRLGGLLRKVLPASLRGT